MSGRRRDQRFTVTQPWEGRLTVLRDVALDGMADGHLTVVSRTPGVVGEQLTVDLCGGGALATLRVSVLESRPVLQQGAVRHCLRLLVLEQTCQQQPPLVRAES